ncbi:hypothetical protein Q9S78_12000 [Microbacterium sp. KSW-18]|uniref:Uncharacterized protein n=1 Tax=Microbacterium aquilitoris TaxID=3067307 RepID=A0ABU3GL01_9MICO|nr:hypothetical protein [Microbacterium sp. KSW-18]MDT3331391.1 hypothetical protein [Microbacterium sp. KSW-18]
MTREEAIAREADREALVLPDRATQVEDVDGYAVTLYLWRDGIVTWTDRHPSA